MVYLQKKHTSMKLYFKHATMNAGKSLMLLAQANQFEERNVPFLCLKSSIDTRDGDDVIASRVGIKRECVSVWPNDNLYDFVNEYVASVQMRGMSKPMWILIDEAQFLTRKQVDELSRVVDYLDINVVCYGLRTDFRTELFEGSKRLMEVADTIEEIKSSCACGNKAMVNARFDSNGNIITNGEQIMIGGNDLYVTLCRKCYNDILKKQAMRDKKYEC